MANRVRINVDIDPEWRVWLNAQRRIDRIRTTERVRALLALAMEDPDLQKRVVEKAVELDGQQNG